MVDPPEWCWQVDGSEKMEKNRPSPVKDFTGTITETKNLLKNIKPSDNWTIYSLSNVLGRAKSNLTCNSSDIVISNF